MKFSAAIYLIILRSSQASVFEDPLATANVTYWPPDKPLPDVVTPFNKIVGGVKVNPTNRYPYQVALTYTSFGGQYCGGSLIASNWVLSAAHCANLGTYVQIGRYDLNDSNESFENIKVKREIPHPSYNSGSFDNDFMLLELETSSQYTPVSIDSGSQTINNNDDVTVIGWGTTSSGGLSSSELLEVEVDVVENEKCNLDYSGGITGNMLCAARLEKDACQGDSGGPLIIRDDNDNSGSGDVLVGVVSWGFGCADPNYPGVYARVSQGYDWISQNANLAPTPPTPPTPTPPTQTSPPEPTFTLPPFPPTDDNCDDEDQFLDKAKKGGELKLRDCSWLETISVNKLDKYCMKKHKYKMKNGVLYKPPHDACARTCHFCFPCNEFPKFRFFYKMKKGKSTKKSCKWLEKQGEKKKEKICSSGDTDGVYPGADVICPFTCDIDSCGSFYDY